MPKRDKVVRSWRKFDDEAIRELYFSAEQNQIEQKEKLEWGSRCGGRIELQTKFWWEEVAWKT